MNLFQLVGQYRELQQIDIEDIDPQTLLDTIEGLGGELELKATNVAMYQRGVQALAHAMKEAALQMSLRGDRVQAKADKIKGYIQSCMEAAQITKIESPELSLVIKKNPPHLVIDNEEEVPSHYKTERVTVTTVIDKKAIKEVLKTESVRGCHIEQGQRLDIR